MSTAVTSPPTATAQLKLVNFGVDTYIVNVKLVNSTGQPTGEELPEQVQEQLNSYQLEAKQARQPWATPLVYHGQTLFIRQHGANPWQWMLFNDLVSLSIGRGTMNGGTFCQARLSSFCLWSVGSQAVVTSEHRRIATLDFGTHSSAISCCIYNKSLEIRKSRKTWFVPIWEQNGYDGASPVWRIEFRFKRDFLASIHMNEAYALLEHLTSLCSTPPCTGYGMSTCKPAIATAPGSPPRRRGCSYKAHLRKSYKRCLSR